MPFLVHGFYLLNILNSNILNLVNCTVLEENNLIMLSAASYCLCQHFWPIFNPLFLYNMACCSVDLISTLSCIILVTLISMFMNSMQVNIRSVDEAIVIGAALSLSSSAFVLQVL